VNLRLAIPGILICLTGCSLKSGDAPTIKLQFEIPQTDFQDLSLENRASHSLAPVSLSEFQCFAFNVISYDIQSSQNFRDANPPAIGDIVTSHLMAPPPSYCTYPGVLSPPLIANTNGQVEATLSLPTGTRRIVQAIGIKDPAGVICNRSQPIAHPSDSSFAYYIVGEREIPSLINPISSFNIQSTYPAQIGPTHDTVRLARRADCGGPSNGGGSGAGGGTSTQAPGFPNGVTPFVIPESTTLTQNLTSAQTQGTITSCAISGASGNVSASSCTVSGGTVSFPISTGDYCLGNHGNFNLTIRDSSGQNATAVVSVVIENTNRSLCQISDTFAGNTNSDYPEFLTPAGDYLFFTAKVDASTRKLFRFNRINRLIEGPFHINAPGTSDQPLLLRHFNGYLFFAAYDASAAAAATLYKLPINATPGVTPPQKVLFSGTTPVTGVAEIVAGTNRLYASNGSDLYEYVPGSGLSNISGLVSPIHKLTPIDSNLFFISNSALYYKPAGLAYYPVPIPGPAGSTYNNLSSITPIQNRVYFTANCTGGNCGSGTFLAYWDIGAANAYLASVGFSNIDQFLVTGLNSVYYIGVNSGPIRKLYRFNGEATPPPTPVIDINGNSVDDYVQDLSFHNGNLFFSARESGDTETNLRILPIGSTTYTSVLLSTDSVRFFDARNYVVVNEVPYFVAHDNQSNYDRIYRITQTNTVEKMGEPSPSANFVAPTYNMTPFDGALYFSTSSAFTSKIWSY